MEVFIQGKGRVCLQQSDFVAQGGEGAVYAKGDLAFKIYTRPGKMIPVAKIQELSQLTDPHILRPQDVLLDSRDNPVGYTMPRVKDATVLCQLFARAFRDRKGITPEAVLRLVQDFQQRVEYVHRQGILIVDLHEMNFLLDSALKRVLFIDVDSYQTPGFPASALMDSIRDRHASGFSEATDWFAFGIVTFQMFIGIHPYKGKHPTLSDLDARMKHHVSVLNREVTIPKVCYPWSVLPPAYRDWYEALFEKGRRLPPPSDPRAMRVVTPRVQRLIGTSRIHVRELATFPAEIIAPIVIGLATMAVTREGIYEGAKRHPVGNDVKIGITPRRNEVIAAWLESGKVRLVNITRQRAVNADLSAEALMAYAGRLYGKSGSTLFEMQFMELPAGTLAALKPIGNVLENATQLFEGVVLQSLLGAAYASLVPKPGVCHQVRLPELDGYQVVDARFDNGVLMLVGVQQGRYDKFILRFDASYRTYDVRKVADIAYTGLNFVVLENGVCVHLNEEEALELFSNRPESQSLKVIADSTVPGIKLFKNGTQVHFTRGDTLYQMTMRS
jgi:serine/threonine protein kinase